MRNIFVGIRAKDVKFGDFIRNDRAVEPRQVKGIRMDGFGQLHFAMASGTDIVAYPVTTLEIECSLDMGLIRI